MAVINVRMDAEKGFYAEQFVQSFATAVCDDLLSPFPVEKYSNRTLLESTQYCYFFSVYLINFLLCLGITGVFLRIVAFNVDCKQPYCAAYIVGLVCQIISPLSVVQSCFVFSRIVYVSSNECSKYHGRFHR